MLGSGVAAKDTGVLRLLPILCSEMSVPLKGS